MKKNNNQCTKPMIPLEYCSPERAARELDCEVEDIFHWAAVGAITIYFEFTWRDFDPGDSSGFDVEGVNPDVNIPFCYLNPATLDNVTDYYSSENIDVYWTGALMHCYGPEGFMNGERLIVTKRKDYLLDNIVYIYGFWAISQYCVHEIQRTNTDDGNLLWDLTAKYIDAEIQDEDDINKEPKDIVAYGVKVPDWARRLRVMRDDLLKIQQHMITGEVMGKKSNSVRPEKGHASLKGVGQAHSSERLTSKQFRFIVELLRSHGLTDADFKGSIPALKLKIAKKAPTTEVKDIHENTLIDWLKRAGVR